MSKDDEIVDLHGTANGRSCEMPDDFVRFKLKMVKIDGTLEEGIKAICIQEGNRIVCFGYLPQNIVNRSKVFYVNATMRRKSNRNLGVAWFRLLKDVLEQV